MNCYLCKATIFSARKGKVRDNPNLQILECNECGLVSLSDDAHISKVFYTNSGMHREELISIDTWLKETE